MTLRMTGTAVCVSVCTTWQLQRLYRITMAYILHVEKGTNDLVANHIYRHTDRCVGVCGCVCMYLF